MCKFVKFGIKLHHLSNTKESEVFKMSAKVKLLIAFFDR